MLKLPLSHRTECDFVSLSHRKNGIYKLETNKLCNRIYYNRKKTCYITVKSKFIFLWWGCE